MEVCHPYLSTSNLVFKLQSFIKWGWRFACKLFSNSCRACMHQSTRGNMSDHYISLLSIEHFVSIFGSIFNLSFWGSFATNLWKGHSYQLNRTHGWFFIIFLPSLMQFIVLNEGKRVSMEIFNFFVYFNMFFTRTCKK